MKRSFLGQWLAFLALGLMGSAPCLAQSVPAPTPAKDLTQIKQNILQNKKGLAEVQKELQEEKKKQRLAAARERSVLARLQKVDQALNKLRQEKEANEDDLGATRDRIDRLRFDIAQNQTQLVQSRLILGRRLRALHRMSFRTPFLGGLLSSDNFGDLARKLKFGMLLAKSNEKILAQTLRHEQVLETASNQWGEEEHRKEILMASLGRREKNFSRERSKRTVFITSIKRQQELREQTISELNDRAQDLQAKVSLLLKTATEVKKVAAASAPVGKGLKVVRGRIPWPVTGEILPDYSFGSHKNKEFNAVVDNTGIQIKAPMGTPIRAVAAGNVRYADWFKGYGKLVILDHGQGYYSLYAQANELNVTEGQKVAAGQVIGTVGDTGSLVGSSLYFEIRKDGVPQDPIRWLKHRS